jgi:3-oxoadipate enol-lactonase
MVTDPLFHRVTGQGAPLVLLHPVGLDHTFWGPLVEQARAVHTVVEVDLAGHGKSATAAQNRDIGAYASDVEALMDHLGYPKATVLGLSFGGMIAQELAVSRPQRVSRLIVGACGSRIPEQARDAVRARGETGPQGMESVIETTLQRWFTPAFMGAALVAQVRERLRSDDPAGWAAGWNAIASFDAHDRLGSLAIPMLAVAAELDQGTPVAATKAIADAVSGAQFTMLPGAPHMMQIECAEAFTQRVMAFLRAGTPS